MTMPRPILRAMAWRFLFASLLFAAALTLGSLPDRTPVVHTGGSAFINQFQADTATAETLPKDAVKGWAQHVYDTEVAPF